MSFRAAAAAVLLTGASLIATAPDAHASCTPSSCDTPFPGSVSDLLATPRVSGVSDQIEAMSEADFVGQQWYLGAGWEEAQITRFVRVKGVTRTSVRAFNDTPGRVTYLSKTKRCARTVSSAHPNTYAEDAKATWTCRSRRASDVDAAAWLLSTLPATQVPPSPSSWFVDYTEESGFPSTEGPPTLGIYVASTRWLEYRMTSTSMEFQDYAAARSQTSPSTPPAPPGCRHCPLCPRSIADSRDTAKPGTRRLRRPVLRPTVSAGPSLPRAAGCRAARR